MPHVLYKGSEKEEEEEGERPQFLSWHSMIKIVESPEKNCRYLK